MSGEDGGIGRAVISDYERAGDKENGVTYFERLRRRFCRRSMRKRAWVQGRKGPKRLNLLDTESDPCDEDIRWLRTTSGM